MKKIKTIISGCFVFLFILSSYASAQTIYKKDPGFFAGIKSLGFRGGSLSSTEQLIGPAVGYRFNKNYDVSLHAEFLHSNTNFGNAAARNLSMLNLGLFAGRTSYFSHLLMLRSQLSYYHAFKINRSGFGSLPKPSLNSVLGSSSFYVRLPLSGVISLLPNVGGFLGYGDYFPTGTNFELSHAFDGFEAGPKLGLDLLFRLSHKFRLSVEPRYRVKYNTTHDYTDHNFELNFGLNF